MLMDESPLLFCRSLAKAIGLEEAIIVQQLRWLLRDRRNGKEIAGDKWIYNTHQEWIDTYFWWMSINTCKRTFLNLEKMGIVISCQPEGSISRRKYYRLNEAMVNRFKKGDVPLDHGVKLHSRGAKLHLPVSEKTSNEYKSKESASMQESRENLDNLNTVSPNPKASLPGKEAALSQIMESSKTPSPEEFQDHIAAANLDFLVNSRPNLYEELKRAKFHEWKAGRWQPIRNWKRFIEGLNNKIAKA